MAAEQEAQSQEAQCRELRRLTKTDPDPRVRSRVQALLLVEHGQTLASVARHLGTAAHRHPHLGKRDSLPKGVRGFWIGRDADVLRRWTRMLARSCKTRWSGGRTRTACWSRSGVSGICKRSCCGSAASGSVPVPCIGWYMPWAIAMAGPPLHWTVDTMLWNWGHPRFRFVPLPKAAAWLNLIEGFWKILG